MSTPPLPLGLSISSDNAPALAVNPAAIVSPSAPPPPPPPPPQAVTVGDGKTSVPPPPPPPPPRGGLRCAGAKPAAYVPQPKVLSPADLDAIVALKASLKEVNQGLASTGIAAVAAEGDQRVLPRVALAFAVMYSQLLTYAAHLIEAARDDLLPVVRGALSMAGITTTESSLPHFVNAFVAQAGKAAREAEIDSLRQQVALNEAKKNKAHIAKNALRELAYIAGEDLSNAIGNVDKILIPLQKESLKLDAELSKLKTGTNIAESSWSRVIRLSGLPAHEIDVDVRILRRKPLRELRTQYDKIPPSKPWEEYMKSHYGDEGAICLNTEEERAEAATAKEKAKAEAKVTLEGSFNVRLEARLAGKSSELAKLERAKLRCEDSRAIIQAGMDAERLVRESFFRKAREQWRTSIELNMDVFSSIDDSMISDVALLAAEEASRRVSEARSRNAELRKEVTALRLVVDELNMKQIKGDINCIEALRLREVTARLQDLEVKEDGQNSLGVLQSVFTTGPEVAGKMGGNSARMHKASSKAAAASAAVGLPVMASSGLAESADASELPLPSDILSGAALVGVSAVGKSSFLTSPLPEAAARNPALEQAPPSLESRLAEIAERRARSDELARQSASAQRNQEASIREAMSPVDEDRNPRLPGQSVVDARVAAARAELQSLQEKIAAARAEEKKAEEAASRAIDRKQRIGGQQPICLYNAVQDPDKRSFQAAERSWEVAQMYELKQDAPLMFSHVHAVLTCKQDNSDSLNLFDYVFKRSYAGRDELVRGMQSFAEDAIKSAEALGDDASKSLKSIGLERVIVIAIGYISPDALRQYLIINTDSLDLESTWGSLEALEDMIYSEVSLFKRWLVESNSITALAPVASAASELLLPTEQDDGNEAGNAVGCESRRITVSLQERWLPEFDGTVLSPAASAASELPLPTEQGESNGVGSAVECKSGVIQHFTPSEQLFSTIGSSVSSTAAGTSGGGWLLSATRAFLSLIKGRPAKADDAAGHLAGGGRAAARPLHDPFGFWQVITNALEETRKTSGNIDVFFLAREAVIYVYKKHQVDSATLAKTYGDVGPDLLMTSLYTIAVAKELECERQLNTKFDHTLEIALAVLTVHAATRCMASRLLTHIDKPDDVVTTIVRKYVFGVDIPALAAVPLPVILGIENAEQISEDFVRALMFCAKYRNAMSLDQSNSISASDHNALVREYNILMFKALRLALNDWGRAHPDVMKCSDMSDGLLGDILYITISGDEDPDARVETNFPRHISLRECQEAPGSSSTTASAAAGSVGWGRASSSKPLAGQEAQYSVAVMDIIALMRLANFGVRVHTAIIVGKGSSSRLIGLEETGTLAVPLLLVHDIQAHWVGILVQVFLGRITVAYIDTDTDRNLIPDHVLALIARSVHATTLIDWKSACVPQQLYRDNCGPTVIERMARILTGRSVPDAYAVAFHSHLRIKADWLVGYPVLQSPSNGNVQYKIVSASAPYSSSQRKASSSAYDEDEAKQSSYSTTPWHEYIKRANAVVRSLDICVDTARFLIVPNATNFKVVAHKYLHLAAMLNGANSVAMMPSLISITYTCYNVGAPEALVEAVVLGAQLAVVTALVAISPIGATAAFFGLGLYSLIDNVLSFYEYYGTASQSLDGLIAHRDQAKWVYEHTGLGLFEILVQQHQQTLAALCANSEAQSYCIEHYEAITGRIHEEMASL